MLPGIRQIVQYIRSYYSSSFSATYLLTVVALLGALLYQNYFGSGIFNLPLVRELPRWLSRYLFYLLPFLAAYLLQFIFFKEVNFFHKKWFWLLLFLAPAFFTFRVHLNLAHYISLQAEGDPARHFHTANLFARSLALIIPVAFCWYCMDSTAKHGYGLKKTTNLSVYFLLLVLMLPFITLASFSSSFLQQYPRAFKAIESSQQTSIFHWLFFETVYALNFLSIEFFFRSFLIIAFLRISGVHAIIPAACFYCCIHFDKPLAEAISSFFGGWLLGIICYYSKSIWGGCLIHVGIAWLMELFAWLQHQ